MFTAAVFNPAAHIPESVLAAFRSMEQQLNTD
jgi:hypothetical protein